MNIPEFAVFIAQRMKTDTYIKVFDKLSVVRKTSVSAVNFTEIPVGDNQFLFVEAEINPNTELGWLVLIGDHVVRVLVNGTSLGIVINDTYLDWNFQQDKLRKYRDRKLTNGPH